MMNGRMRTFCPILKSLKTTTVTEMTVSKIRMKFAGSSITCFCVYLVFAAYFHGKNGPLHIEKLRFAPGLEYWLEAGKEMGYKVIDPNGYQRIGTPLKSSN